MTGKEDDWIGDELPDGVLEEVRRLAEKSSPHTPYFDNLRGHQQLAELEMARDLARGMGERGQIVSQIEPNVDDQGRPDDPPDVLAEMDGMPIGVEVTSLLDYVSAQTERQTQFFSDHSVATLTWRMRGGQVDFLRWDAPGLDEDRRCAWEQLIRADPRTYLESWATWSLERFQQRLGEIVETKDKKLGAKKKRRLSERSPNALDRHLSENVLLVFTPERYLQPQLPEYLKKTELARPENFTRVFVMGDEARRGESWFRSIFDVRLS